MAWNLRKAGPKAVVTTAVNALVPSAHPGQDAQLARVQTFIASEIALFPAGSVNVLVSGHFDGKVSTININIQPANLNTNGEVLSVP